MSRQESEKMADYAEPPQDLNALESDQTLTENSKGVEKKRDLKKQGKQEEKQLAMAKVAEKDKRGDEQQMINQNIIYAPQIIFMAKNEQDEKYFVGDNNPERNKYYNYDPQKIEKSN